MNGCILILATIVLLPTSGAGADTVKIGVASTGREVHAMISNQASRAPYILIFDQKAQLIKVIENRDVAARGAGGQIALTLKGMKVTHYIAGRFGDNLVRALDEAKIKHFQSTGAVDEAVKQLIREIEKGARPVGSGNMEGRPPGPCRADLPVRD